MPEPATLALNAAVVAGRVLLATKPRHVRRLKARLKGRNQVAIFGSTGVGKTQLISSLTELMPDPISYLDRTTFPSGEDVEISKSFFRVWDTPGQDANAVDRIEVLRRLGKRTYGVINVVAAGYHEYRADLTTVFNAKDSVNPAFLEAHRQVDLDQLRKMIPLLQGDNRLKWFITVVAKADLWWDRRGEVFAYYETGPYAQELQPLRWIGGHTVLDYSSVARPFYATHPGSGLYGDDDRRRAREQLLSSLITAIASH